MCVFAGHNVYRPVHTAALLAEWKCCRNPYCGVCALQASSRASCDALHLWLRHAPAQGKAYI